MELIRLNNISFSYNESSLIYDNMNFVLKKGDRLGIIGPNGAGKSTLFNLAMGLLQPQKGTIEGLGKFCQKEKDFRPLRNKIGYLFQDPEDQLFCATVAEDIAFGPLNQGKTRQQALKIVSKVLAQVGLQGFEKRVTYQLSGGEKHLVALACVLAMEPLALLLDEPSNGLDDKHLALLEKVLLNSDLSWAIVSHEKAFLKRTCDQILRLNQGQFHSIDF